ncbi:hypothetical protein EUX57_06075 [Pseudomonas orientalis]|uniref:Uncharacterized protein n=1 Tax=Pseudomonas orientalis TaxID=76758 RepID=A0A4Q7D1C4_9PSED|nr:hypothetical protein EUX57_06075 [Pseudomonas orientalis]
MARSVRSSLSPKTRAGHRSKCGRGRAPDEHRSPHNAVAPNRNHDAQRAALDPDLDLLLILISGAPLNHAGRTQA